MDAGEKVIVTRLNKGTDFGKLASKLPIENVNVTLRPELPTTRSVFAMATKAAEPVIPHDPVDTSTNEGLAHATGARNVIPLCITANSMDGRVSGTLAFNVTTISTADTAVQLLDTAPSRNRALHAAPMTNGLPVTVTEDADGSSTRGVTLMMTGAWASRSVMA